MKVIGDLPGLRRWLGDAGDAFARADGRLLPTERLIHSQREIVACFARESRYTLPDVGILWRDQQAYLHDLRAGAASAASAMPLHGSRAAMRHQYLADGPAGRVLVCLPSNAAIPLTAILAACSEFTGNRTVFTRPKGVQRTVGMILSALCDGLESFALYEKSPRDIVEAGALRCFDLVYFMGSSGVFPLIAAACAEQGTNLIFEGQGNSIIFVGQSAANHLGEVIREILNAKSFCNGRMCSAPNSILLAPGLLDAFLESWEAQSCDFPVAPISATLTDESLAWINTRMPSSEATWLESRSPMLVSALDAADLPAFEFFAPIASVAACHFDDAFALMAGSRYRLQASYFGSDPSEIALIRRLPFSRLTINVNPADQDPLLPWGSYGRSGSSPLRTFSEKMAVAKLIEISES